MGSNYHTPGELLAHYAVDQDIGSRGNQEDYATAQPMDADGSPCRELLCVLADGMGGYAGGEIASRVVVSSFVRVIKSGCDGLAPSRALLRAAQQADEALRVRKAAESAELASMGSTLCAAWIKGGMLHFINVGDSLIYLLRENQLYRLNHRHNHCEDMQRQAISQGLDWAVVSQQESVIRYGSRITSYIGGMGISQAHCPEAPLPLQPGDVILLASDGLLTLTNREIAETMRPYAGSTVRQDVERMLDLVLAKHARHQDNVSAVLVRIDK